VLLLKNGDAAVGLLYLFGTVALGLAVAWLGMFATRAVTAPRSPS